MALIRSEVVVNTNAVSPTIVDIITIIDILNRLSATGSVKNSIIPAHPA
jgi:hypothetical protein